MSFSVFNLGRHIQEYNHHHKKQLSDDETFGIAALSVAALENHRQVANLFIGCASQANSLIEYDARYPMKQQLLQRSDPAGINLINNGVLVRSSLSLAQQKLAWHTEVQQMLKPSGAWQKLAADAVLNQSVEALQSIQLHWQQSSSFHHYSSGALAEAAEEHLLEIECYLLAMRRGLKKRRRKVPKKIRKDLQSYLTFELNKCREQQQQLCWAMLWRLQLAAENKNLYFDDVVLHCVKVLQQAGLWQRTIPVDFQSEGLSPSLLQRFHRYLECYGSKEQQKMLSELAWFKAPTLMVTLSYKQQHLLVPKSIAASKLVPTTYCHKRLFKRRWYRMNFFRQRLGLMAHVDQLSHISSQDVSFELSFLTNTFSSLSALEQELQDSDSAIKAWQPKGMLSYAHRASAKFAKKWFGFSCEIQRQIMQHKLRVVHEVRLKMEATVAASPNPNQLISRQYSQLLQVLVAEIEFALRDVVLTQETNNTFTQDCQKITELCERLQQITSQPQSVSRSAPMAEQESVSVRGVSQPRVAVSASQPSVAQSRAEGMVMGLSDVRIVEQSEQSFDRILNEIVQLSQQLSEQATLDSVRSLKEMVGRLFVDYVGFIAQCQDFSATKLFDQRLMRIEKVLLEYGDETISSRLKPLLAYRHNKDKWFIVKMRSQAYVKSFTGDSTQPGDAHVSIKAI